jgi:exopolysaccharide/PEP-CTERM locus tyrosine autokinase
MGKIFDALEKANTQKADAKPLTRPRSDSKESIKSTDNVVSIGNAVKIGHELNLDPKLVTYHAPQSVEAELFKVLRTNLLFPATGKPCKKILVTSALPSDGKSFVSSNLAISIAQGVEEYVLLIDGDVRRPTIHSNFGFGQVVGLSEHLATGVDIAKILLKSPVPKLTIFPAGQPPRNPTELLSSKKMQTLLGEVASRYDDRFILIDSPPPSMAAETTAIVNFVDGVILVVRAGKTPKKAVAETIEQIGKEKIVGIVLNYSDQALKRYYGYGKSYYDPKEK